MKKIITFCLFTCAMILGTNTISAQSVVEINKAASEKTLELKKFVKFGNDAQRVVYSAYQDYTQSTYATSEMRTKGTAPSEQDIDKADRILKEKLKSTFTAEEYDRCLKYMDTKK